MSRRTRRRIKRKPRKKLKPRKKKGFLNKHLDTPITNRWTKITTYWLMAFEGVFVIWWLQETMLNWHEIIARLKEIFLGG